ncbi:hypothetical protein BDW02DRAFT_506863 [Decorospora gaudefroyi]|uniref:Uncharacterized protein n=1 Tax=Decorospora gaudefroyi TaxID=184978 RepID=A0A6A5K314_9PLEO|nr:hypothetical protein BDW02DRAFT_506863 [Decorospora gaudefroyi]
MTRILVSLAAFVVALAPLVNAGVTFTSPKAGAKLTAGTAISVEWKEGGPGAKLADLLSYEVFLIVGGNTDETQYPVATITTSGLFTAGNQASGLILDTACEDLKDANAYFIKMVAVGKKGGRLTTYSDRFAYSDMKGKNILDNFPKVKPAVAKISGTDGPDPVDATGDKAVGAEPTVVIDDDLFKVEYTMQTGLTRYAPMQPVPPTKITATNTAPLYPTSKVVLAKTKLPIPSVVTTVTASQTYSVKSMENTVAAAPHATDDMAKFLRRWQD